MFLKKPKSKKKNGTASLLAFSYKTKHAITIRLKNCTLGIHDGEIKTYIYTKTNTWVLITALLLIPKTKGKKTNVLQWLNG